jgi:hypothetical protein
MAAYQEDTNSPLILVIGAVSGFLVIVIVIGLQAWFLSEEQQEYSEVYSASENYQLKELRIAQQANTGTYRWIDREKKIVAVPVDDAMKMLIENKGKLPQ